MLVLAAPPAVALEQDFSGYATLELTTFPAEPLDPRQESNDISLAVEPEYALQWDDGRQSFITRLFGRWDQADEARSHADIREMMWLKAAENWELQVGIGKVFWGVAESRHLVDIINQSDLVENIDLEEKLGQPMVDLTLIQDWGTLDFFVLPYFRERTFPGVQGRPRTQPYVDTRKVIYESARKQQHIDYALRYAHSIDQWDLGLSYFYGTNRDPLLLPEFDSKGELLALIPYYRIIRQYGLDLQGTFDAWLLKLEVMQRFGTNTRYLGVVGGFEYTFYGVFGSSADIGVLTEYLYDSRGQQADTPFQDDILVGARLALNDEQSTEILLGPLVDRQTNSISYNLEASRRLGDSWKMELEIRYYENLQRNDLAYSFRNDDYIRFVMGYYF